MPITLRNVRPDAAAKLRQLEAGAAAVDRAARDLIPEDLRYRTGPPLADRVAVKARSYLGPAASAARGTVAAIVGVFPYIAAALRILHMLVIDMLVCVSVAGALLFVLAVTVMILAPPV